MIRKILSLLMIVLLSLPATADQPIETAHSHQEVSEQAEGNYPDLKRGSSVPLASIQRAWDNAEPRAGVRILHFDPRETIRVVLREYMATTLIFPNWERIEHVLVGDDGNYEAHKIKDNIVTIKPVNYVGMDTNFTLIGESGHVYSFYVRVEGHNSKNIPDIAVRIIAHAPAGMDTNVKPFLAHELEEKPDYLEAARLDASKLNFNFSMSGEESIAPNLVYSDGIRTWFDYGDDINMRDIPSFFSVVDGYQKAVNVAIEGNRLVAEGSGSFVLKSGNKVTCVYPTPAKGKRV